MHDDVVRPGSGFCEVSVLFGQSALDDEADDELPSLAPTVADPGRDDDEEDASCDVVCAVDKTGAAIRTARVAVTAARETMDFMAMTLSGLQQSGTLGAKL